MTLWDAPVPPKIAEDLLNACAHFKPDVDIGQLHVVVVGQINLPLIALRCERWKSTLS